MSKGRQPKTYKIELPDTGIELEYRKVSQAVVDDIRRERTKTAPQPPIETVETADGKTSQIPNTEDLDYSKALAAYETETNALVMNAFLRIGVVLDTQDPDVKAAIEQERALMESAGVVSDEQDPKMFYIKYVAGGGEDLGDLATAIATRSMPSAEVVEATKS